MPTRLSAVMQMQHCVFDARDVGVGQFSVLSCFCAHHDKILFAPLQDRPLTFSPEQIALLHYRAISAEAYQRRNAEDGAQEECGKYSSYDPARERFYAMFQIHSLAAETAEETLNRTERILERSLYGNVRAMVARFNAQPALLSVGAFRPLYDVTGIQLQDLTENSAYVAMHVLIAEGKPVLIFTWLRGQRAAERFAKSFAAQPLERLTTMAIQAAFEHAEHTCMRREWWIGLAEEKRVALLRRVKNNNSLSYIRPTKSLPFRTTYDDWNCDRIDFMG